MTGFGTADGAVGAHRLSVEVRTVNHRFFSPSIKLPGAFARWEGEVREALRAGVARGHVSLSARIIGSAEGDDPTGGAQIDDARFAAYVGRLRELQARHGLSGALDIATVLRLPDVVRAAAPEEETAGVEELVAVVQAAVVALTATRVSEGTRLADVLRERLAIVASAVERIALRAPERMVAHRDRLRANVQELSQGVAVDPQRLAQEVAILADRLDIHEEIDRFRSHLIAFRDALASTTGEPVGKRLGFLLQELLREANTTGSKANDAPMLADVVAIKEELERIREQVENLE